MKLILFFVSCLFVSSVSFAHCGSCGAGSEGKVESSAKSCMHGEKKTCPKRECKKACKEKCKEKKRTKKCMKRCKKKCRKKHGKTCGKKSCASHKSHEDHGHSHGHEGHKH